jgi:TPR repeat protein
MLEEAFHWASKAVEAGHIEAHIVIAWFYETGNVVNVDYETSHKFLTLAAGAGNEGAKELLKRYRKNIRGDIYLPQ